MAKKSVHLSIITKNTPFEEAYNLLTYESASTKLKKLTFSRKEEEISFVGLRTISSSALSLGSSFTGSFPSEIEIHIRGSIDVRGNFILVTSVPDTYSQYLQGKETMEIRRSLSKAGTPVEVDIVLNYKIVPASEEGLFGSIKGRTYNNMVASIESHVIGYYGPKRKNSIGVKPIRSIKTLAELSTALK